MLVAGVILLTVAPGASASPSVSVFPSPGTQYAAPAEQIVFRGIAPNQIGNITVTGSRTGTHTGQFKNDSDGQGASFFPNQQFAPGETVTVKTGLNIVGASGGTFHFKIDTPFGNIGPETINFVPAGAHGITHYRSRPDLLPAAVSISNHGAPASDGDIFVAPQIGPGANGPDAPGSERQPDLVPPAGQEHARDRLPRSATPQPACADVVAGVHEPR